MNSTSPSAGHSWYCPPLAGAAAKGLQCTTSLKNCAHGISANQVHCSTSVDSGEVEKASLRATKEGRIKKGSGAASALPLPTRSRKYSRDRATVFWRPVDCQKDSPESCQFCRVASKASAVTPSSSPAVSQVYSALFSLNPRLLLATPRLLGLCLHHLLCKWPFFSCCAQAPAHMGGEARVRTCRAQLEARTS